MIYACRALLRHLRVLAIIYPPFALTCSVKPVGPWFSPQCDTNFSPPKCSKLYHNQEQTPGYPTGDGNCAAPGCDCGDSPCVRHFFHRTIVARIYCDVHYPPIPFLPP